MSDEWRKPPSELEFREGCFREPCFREPCFREPCAPPEEEDGGPWWLSGGIAAADCWAAYQPKGAASFAASKLDLNGGGKLDPLMQRAELWALRYQDVKTRGRMMACGDQKFKWVLGPTEHCSTCAKLAGLVHRGSQWRNYVLPQNPPNEQLECGGWNCRCSLEPTTERASRRYPPLP